MVTVADIDRWNSEQVREVFHRTQQQIAACDTMVAQFTNLSVFGQWSGQTAEAAKTSISGTILDFTDHKDEAAVIANAAKERDAADQRLHSAR